MAVPERVDDFSCACECWVAPASVRAKQHMFARHLEGGHVAREPPISAEPQAYPGMRVGGANTCDRPLLEKLIPLRKVIFWRARQPHERELIVHPIKKQRIQQGEEIILAPGGVLVPDFHAVEIGCLPVGPRGVRMEWMGEYPKGASGTGRSQQITVIFCFRLRPGRWNTKREEMSGARADLHP